MTTSCWAETTQISCGSSMLFAREPRRRATDRGRASLWLSGETSHLRIELPRSSTDLCFLHLVREQQTPSWAGQVAVSRAASTAPRASASPTASSARRPWCVAVSPICDPRSVVLP